MTRSDVIRAGVACIDITPPAGLAMAGFGARTEPATGTHDSLTVRAIVVNDTAFVVADVIGLHEDMSRRVRARCILPDDNVVLAALHTHGGPASMEGRAGGNADPAYLQRLEEACVEAIDRAAASAVPARLSAGMGEDPDVARNRRHADGPLDRALPVLRIESLAGKPIAFMVSYACHPVVLGADNRLWTADYPHFVRAEIEAAVPGALAVFVTGCVGDANSGHSAHASLSLASNPDRTFARAEILGKRIADAALAAPFFALDGVVSALNAEQALSFARRETLSSMELAKAWRAELPTASPMRALILHHWIGWAETIAPRPLVPWIARVSVLDWAGLPIVALPGEIFAETSLFIRAKLDQRLAIIAGFSEGNPGYIPPASEFQFGGYEVDEAHRYYGMPATFASGSAEALAEAATSLFPDRSV